jgi:small subunit ribosomal protein S17
MREHKKLMIGRVVSDKMEKTVVVSVQKLRRHRLYQRTMRQTRKYMAHDEQNECRLGDLVRIQESRPISRHKHWRIIEVIERAAQRGKAVDIPEVAQVLQILPGPESEVSAIAGAAPASAEERSQ